MRCAALALAVTVVLGSREARADRGDTAWSVEAGYALVAVDTREPSGAALAGSYLRGWNDAIALRLTGSYSLHAATEAPGKAAGPLHVASATAGVTYAFDYLRIIPFLEASVGGLYLHGPDGIDSGVRATFELGVGADVLESRSFSWGFVARMQSFLPDADSAPVYTYFGPRLTWRFSKY